MRTFTTSRLNQPKLHRKELEQHKGKTVIIANHRRGSDYWEGYAERKVTEADTWVDYFHSIGSVVKVFKVLTSTVTTVIGYLTNGESSI